jgi:hypothetical protein
MKIQIFSNLEILTSCHLEVNVASIIHIYVLCLLLLDRYQHLLMWSNYATTINRLFPKHPYFNALLTATLLHPLEA